MCILYIHIIWSNYINPQPGTHNQTSSPVAFCILTIRRPLANLDGKRLQIAQCFPAIGAQYSDFAAFESVIHGCSTCKITAVDAKKNGFGLLEENIKDKFDAGFILRIHPGKPQRLKPPLSHRKQ